MNLVNIDFKLGQIDGKLDQLLEQSSGVEKRVTVLEVFRWKMAGALGAWLFVLTSVLAWLEHGRK